MFATVCFHRRVQTNYLETFLFQGKKQKYIKTHFALGDKQGRLDQILYSAAGPADIVDGLVWPELLSDILHPFLSSNLYLNPSLLEAYRRLLPDSFLCETSPQNQPNSGRC